MESASSSECPLGMTEMLIWIKKSGVGGGGMRDMVAVLGELTGDSRSHPPAELLYSSGFSGDVAGRDVLAAPTASAVVTGIAEITAMAPISVVMISRVNDSVPSS